MIEEDTSRSREDDTVEASMHSVAVEQAMQDQLAEEKALLRDTLNILQGISGYRLQIQENDESLCVSSSAAATCMASSSNLLGSGALDALKQCGEAGGLYLRIQTFVQKSTDSAILRALQQATQSHLQTYLGFLTQLESKLRVSMQQQQSSVNAALTMNLRQIYILTRPARQDLLSLAIVVEGVMEFSGPDILTALALHTRHGNARHVRIVQSLLEAASAPWWNVLRQWTTCGQLIPSSLEFFVERVDGIEGKDLWGNGFVLHTGRVPSVFDKDLVDTAFQAGKGINYIRRVLLDGIWSLELQEDDDKRNNGESDETGSSPPSQSIMLQMRRTIRQASHQVHSHILESLWDKYALMDHMSALKKFLLLGQGDFYSALMDGLHAEYGFHDNNSKVVYRYNVASIMDTALRNTNANDLNDQVIGRLHVDLQFAEGEDTKYLIGFPMEGARSVWELFCLDYTLPDPLVAVVDNTCMQSYKDLFLFLFNVKRIEYMLHTTWRQSAVLQHALQVTAQKNTIKVSNNAAYAQASMLLRQVSMTRQAMTHFVVNLKNYLFFEVVEDGWKRLVRKLNTASTLDEVIDAHRSYLATIKRKSMLPTKALDAPESRNIGGLSEHVAELLNLSKFFCDYQHRVFASALEAADQAARKRRIFEKRIDDGSWGVSSEREDKERETFFGLSDTTELESLGDLSNEFTSRVKKLILSVDEKLRGGSAVDEKDFDDASAENRDDLDSLRFLKFQLSCNGYYDETAQ